MNAYLRAAAKHPKVKAQAKDRWEKRKGKPNQPGNPNGPRRPNNNRRPNQP